MTPTTDHNLLLGELAVLNGFLDREALVGAIDAWRTNGFFSLRQVLLQQGVLRPDELDALEALVALHTKRVGSDARYQNEIGTPSTQMPTRDGDPLPMSQRCETRFRVLRPHAKGGLGEVFVALDSELNREVALKEIKAQHADNADSRARFLLEAEITGRLEHPGIVPVYGLGCYADGRPFYAMRFVKGKSLLHALQCFHADEALKNDEGRRVLELRQLLGRFVAVCNAVAYAHSKGVLHRDLKPDNVMLGNYGETLVVDWGLAKAIGAEEEATPAGSVTLRLSGPESGLTQAGHVLGTPQYMSPEQASGQNAELTSASDVYSLGATLYHLLTGTPPFVGGDAYALLERTCRGQFPLPREIDATIPPALQAVCLKAMALGPEQRYTSVKDLADEIEHWLADEPVAAYKEPLRLRLGRWRRRHPALVTGTAALVFAVVVGLGLGAFLLSQEQSRTRQAEGAKAREQENRALAQVNTLLNAKPQAVRSILQGLAPFREQLRDRLRQERDRPEPIGATAAVRELWQQHRIRAALALLPDDPGQIVFLKKGLFSADIPPEEMLLIRDELPITDELVRELWAEVDWRDREDPGRFRAVVALAHFDPRSPRWVAASREIIGSLLASEPPHIGVWSAALRGVSSPLRGPLSEAFRDQSRPALARQATYAVVRIYSERPEILADLLADADAQQFPLMLAALQPHRDRAIVLLEEMARSGGVESRRRSVVGEHEQDRQGQRRANVAVALLRLGRPERAWPLLRHSPHPDARTYLLHRAGPLGADVGLLLRRLNVEDDPFARQALILSLGEYTAEQLPDERRKKWTPLLLDWYRDHPDPGVHAAIDWLLRHDREGPLPRRLDWGLAKELEKIDAALASRGRPRDEPLATGRPRWYVNGQGQTMVVLGPGEFVMGSPPHEANRSADELPHRRRIGRRFALACKKVTVAQFWRFKKDHPEVLHTYTERFSPDADGPIISVTWYEAAQFCNWLSKQEGIPEDQWCYPPIAEIEACKKNGKPLRLPADYLSRTGYRLPTEAEWEFACRAGAESSRFYGSSTKMLGQYAWYQENAVERTWPVGQKKPNAFGLFDMHGNTWDWCQEGYAPYPTGTRGRPAEDVEDKRDVIDPLNRMLRGGSFYSRPTEVRCAFRLNYRPSGRVVFLGFGLRVARTCK